MPLCVSHPSMSTCPNSTGKPAWISRATGHSPRPARVFGHPLGSAVLPSVASESTVSSVGSTHDCRSGCTPGRASESAVLARTCARVGPQSSSDRLPSEYAIIDGYPRSDAGAVLPKPTLRSTLSLGADVDSSQRPAQPVPKP